MEVRRFVVYYMKEKGKRGGLRFVDKLTDYLIDNEKVYVHGYYPIYDKNDEEEGLEHEKGRFADLTGHWLCIIILSWLSNYRGKNAVKTYLKRPAELYG